MLQSKKERPTIKVYNRGKGEDSMPIEFYNSQKEDNKYRCALEAFMNPVKILDKKIAIEQINDIYRLKKNRLTNNIEYSSLERLEELFGIDNNKER